MLLGQSLLLLLDILGLPVQILLFLLQPALLLLQVRPAALFFLLVLSAVVQDLLLGLQQSLALFALRGLDGLVDNTARFLLRAGDLLFPYHLAVGDAEKEENRRHHSRDYRSNHDILKWHVRFSSSFDFA